MEKGSRRAFVRWSGWVLGALVALFAFGSLGCFGRGGSGGGAQHATTAQAPTGSGPATLRIVNASNEAIYSIHMSPTAQSTWGPNLLGSQVLHRGQVFTISNIAPGQWDLRVVDASRNFKEWRGAWFEAGGVYDVEVSAGGWSR